MAPVASMLSRISVYWAWNTFCGVTRLGSPGLAELVREPRTSLFPIQRDTQRRLLVHHGLQLRAAAQEQQGEGVGRRRRDAEVGQDLGGAGARHGHVVRREVGGAEQAGRAGGGAEAGKGLPGLGDVVGERRRAARPVQRGPDEAGAHRLGQQDRVGAALRLSLMPADWKPGGDAVPHGHVGLEHRPARGYRGRRRWLQGFIGMTRAERRHHECQGGRDMTEFHKPLAPEVRRPRSGWRRRGARGNCTTRC